MSSELVIRVENTERGPLVYVSGEIDIYTAQQFKDDLYQVVDGSESDVTIDCIGLNYIDSTGLGIFVGALKKTKLNGRNIYIINMKDNIKKLFVITGLDKLFIIN
ncbi:MAG: STAS domain-containing protein [Clostridiaceae bacterium]|nr:STAS domain-containing protein [Clostridiaceae bacterium]